MTAVQHENAMAAADADNESPLVKITRTVPVVAGNSIQGAAPPISTDASRAGVGVVRLRC
jgi:hypothetical protein